MDGPIKVHLGNPCSAFQKRHACWLSDKHDPPSVLLGSYGHHYLATFTYGNYDSLIHSVMSELRYLPVLLLLGLCCTGGDAVDSQVIHGVMGGQVTFRCVSQPDLPLNFVYFNKILPQKGNAPGFVNGYHQRRKLSVKEEYSNRTHVNSTERTMTMTDIRPTDEGWYQCQIEYDNIVKNDTYMKLIVTAEYSKPVTSIVFRTRDVSHHSYENQGNDSDCVATCSCHGGYPRRQVEWNSNLPLNRTWAVILPGNWSQNPDTKLFNISSTLVFNCSSSLQHLSCMCGGAVTEKRSVCPAVSPQNMAITIAVACIAALLGISGLSLCIRSRRSTDRRNQAGVL